MLLILLMLFYWLESINSFMTVQTVSSQEMYLVTGQ